jgi:hypothetical protein
VSTIKVDTYLTRGGASEIAIDKLKGVTAAGSMLVVGEGGTNTTNLQQGLCKFFSNIIGTGTIATRDSFNQSGITDNGTGDYDFTITNNMNSDDYSQQLTVDYSSGHVGGSYSEGEQNAGGFRIFVAEIHVNTTADAPVAMVTVHGDLA